MKFGDLRRLLDYETVIEEAVDKYKEAAKAQVGATVDVPNVRVRVGKKLFEQEAHKIRRLE